MLNRIFGLYCQEGGKLSQRQFYSVVRKVIGQHYEGQDIDIIRTGEGMALRNLRPEGRQG